MYELIIFSQLMRHPAHGYLIAKIINGMIGPFARISNGSLYPLLSKLEKAKLIAAYHENAAGQQGDRQFRSYTITEAGRRRFRELMMDTTSNPGGYRELFLYKATVLDCLMPAERLRLIDHYINYCQSHILHLTSGAEDFAQITAHWCPTWTPPQLDITLNVMQHTIDQWQLELDWARTLRARAIALSTDTEPDLQNGKTVSLWSS